VGDLCVIFNPKAGRTRAARRFAELQRRWGRRVTFRATERPGHAEELARAAADAGFATVAAVGGDGTVHEVGNGLLHAGRTDVTFAVVPVGSANDYAYSLTHDNGQAPSDAPRLVDTGLVRDERGRERHFLCCLGTGLNGAVTLESRRIRRLQGMALYGLATLRALWYHYACPLVEFTIDNEVFSAPTLLLSVLVGKREGGFVMAPEARLDDGLFDYLQAGQLSRWEVLSFLPRVALAGPPAHHPRVRQGRCRRLTLCSEAPLIVHTDGEFFCRPEDDVRRLEIRILPRSLRVRVGLPAAVD
jgi:diacylglycerol kinase family enzyme